MSITGADIIIFVVLGNTTKSNRNFPTVRCLTHIVQFPEIIILFYLYVGRKICAFVCVQSVRERTRRISCVGANFYSRFPAANRFAIILTYIILHARVYNFTPRYRVHLLPCRFGYFAEYRKPFSNHSQVYTNHPVGLRVHIYYTYTCIYTGRTLCGRYAELLGDRRVGKEPRVGSRGRRVRNNGYTDEPS